MIDNIDELRKFVWRKTAKPINPYAKVDGIAEKIRERHAKVIQPANEDIVNETDKICDICGNPRFKKYTFCHEHMRMYWKLLNDLKTYFRKFDPIPKSRYDAIRIIVEYGGYETVEEFDMFWRNEQVLAGNIDDITRPNGNLGIKRNSYKRTEKFCRICGNPRSSKNPFCTYHMQIYNLVAEYKNTFGVESGVKGKRIVDIATELGKQNYTVYQLFNMYGIDKYST